MRNSCLKEFLRNESDLAILNNYEFVVGYEECQKFENYTMHYIDLYTTLN